MKNHILTLGVAVLMLASCQNNPSQTANTVVSETTTMMENAAEKVEEMVTPQLLATYVEEGKVERTDKGFTLVSKADNHKSFYITKGDNIVQVGEDGKEPKMVKEYTLTKQM